MATKLHSNNTSLQQALHMLPIVGASIYDTYLYHGIIFKRPFVYAGHEQQTKSIKNPTFLLLNHELEWKHTKEYAQLQIESPKQYAQFVETEYGLLQSKWQQIMQTQCNIVLNANATGDLTTQFVAKHANMFQASRIPMHILQQFALVLQCPIHVSMEQLPNCATTTAAVFDMFEEVSMDENRYCRAHINEQQEQTPPHCYTLVLRGASEQVLAEAERTLHDVTSVTDLFFKDGHVLHGAGATEIALAHHLLYNTNKNASLVDTSCYAAFAAALEQLVCILCSNSGMNGLDMVHQLHTKQPLLFGLHVQNKCIAPIHELNIWEPSSVKLNALECAVEAACIILSIDYVIQLPPDETDQQRSDRIAQELQQKKQAEREWKLAMASKRAAVHD